MRITINEEKLKKIIKEAIKEIIEEGKMGNILKSIPTVSEKEMKDINKVYGKPTQVKCQKH